MAKFLFYMMFFGVLVGPLPAVARIKTIEMDVKSGTGFFVTPRHVVTNQHVVDGCKEIVVRGAVKPNAATLLASDKAKDLALLKVEEASPRTAYLRSNPGLKAGDKLYVIGYPEKRAETGEYLLKEATVVDPAFNFEGTTSILFTDAVEQGNSGGPLLDVAGNVIGVVVGKLSYFKRNDQGKTTDKPYQIRGVAIGLPILKSFLHSHGVFVTETSTYDVFPNPHPDELAKQYTINVLCIKKVREVVK